MSVKAFALTILLAAAAFGQTQPVDRVLHFSNTQTPQGFQEITNAVRSLAEIQRASVDNTAKNLVLSGTAAQIDTAAWLFQNLDVPAGGRGAMQQYEMADNTIPAVRVFYLSATATPQSTQELINSIRSIVEIQRIVAVNAPRAIAMRGVPEQVAAAEWLIQALDRPAGSPPAGTLEYRLANNGPGRPWLVPADTNVVRLFYPKHTPSPQALQEIINATRSIAELQRVVAYNEQMAVVLRGTAPQVALADWLIQKLDVPGAPPSSEYPVSGAGDIAGVFYPTGSTTPQSLQELLNAVRTTTQIQRALVVSGPKALVLRGTPDQIARAEKLVQAH